MNPFRADLHCHTSCSDGLLSPQELVLLAKQNGLSGLSITDHDTVDAYETAIPLCTQLGISLITGVEFSTFLMGSSVHILGYGFNPRNPEIARFCQRHKERRKARNQAIIDLLCEHGMALCLDDVAAILPSSTHMDNCTVGRPHIAMAMVQKGYVSTIQEAFKKYIGEDKSCFSQGNPFTVEETIDVLHKANGLAVIAHPHLLPSKAILKALLELPFDGIECYYAKFTSAEHTRWLNIARQKNWLATGGSDFHGPFKDNLELGCSWVNEKAFQAIHQRLNSIT